MPTALVISPHADDASIFCGGVLAKRAAEGWTTVLVRVTDDGKDAMSGTEEETRNANQEQLQHAAKHLGISVIEELGFATDCLSDVDRVILRERFVFLYRKYRPHTVYTFDPYARFEENRDHVVCAQAAQEAFWVACFHLHHPEHLEAGLAPYSVAERWYFSRENEEANHEVDITGHIQQKIDAVCAHETMVQHILHQMRMQLESLGRKSPILDDAIEDDPVPLVSGLVQSRCNANPGAEQSRYVEHFRLERLGALEPFLMAISEPS